MSNGIWLLSTWDLQPSVVIGCVLLLAVYVQATERRITPKAGVFLAGVLALGIALLSVIDVLGDSYLFSLHMIQHLLLVDVVVPLMILGTPSDVFSRLLAWPTAARVEKVLSKTWLAWMIGVLTLWVWHLPVLYDAAVAHETLHVIEHLFFLVSAAVFWWPILSPLEEHRISPLSAFLYLMTGVVANSLLGILLTYTPPNVYTAYQNPVDVLGVLTIIRNQWHLTRLADQQLGGLIMWIPGGLVYLLAILNTVSRWYAEEEPGLQAINSELSAVPMESSRARSS